jgi:hypothetical protein
LLCLNFFDENIAYSNSNSTITYGMRFYPFISSKIKHNFFTNIPIYSVVIELPDKYRLIFFKSKVNQNHQEATLSHS